MTCCGDIDKMLSNPEAHFMVQRARSVRAMSITPESIRAELFITQQVEPARKAAERAARLKKMTNETRVKILKAGKRLGKIEEALIGLFERSGQIGFAEEARLRSPSAKRSSASRGGTPS